MVETTSENGRSTLVFTRTLPHPIDRVWNALTEPGELRLWAPYTASRPLTSPGEVNLVMLGDGEAPDEDVPGTVLRIEAPRLLEYDWGADRLRWELEEERDGTRLVLRHTLDDPGMASGVAAGWHLCLDVAESVLEGAPVPPQRGAKAMEHGWDDLNQRYAAALGVEPMQPRQ